MDVRGLGVVRFACLGLMVVLLVRIAWIADDALITLRTALNATHGWGLGFNSTEAVQAYTSPLWFLAWTASGWASGEWVMTVLALSLVCTTGAIALVLWRAAPPALVIMVTGLLASSNSFMEYGTSGLENPLAYLVVGLCIAIAHAWRYSLHGTWQGVALGALAGAVVLTRLDLVLVVLPVALLVAWKSRSRPRFLGAALVAFSLPVVSWLSWSAWKYGAALPNTFDAKRNLDIPQSELLVQGLRYLWTLLEFDPVTAIGLAFGVALLLRYGKTGARAWSIGVLSYIAYIVWIGGDFMGGRFLAVPFYIVVFVAVLEFSPRVNLRPQNRGRTSTAISELGTAAGTVLIVAACLAVLSGMDRLPVAWGNPMVTRWDWQQFGGVADERGFYMTQRRGLQHLLMDLGSESPSGEGESAAGVASLAQVRYVAGRWPVRSESKISARPDVRVACGQLGIQGIMSGPTVHWVDTCALTDRFLASQPFSASGYAWRVGHFERALPDGYLEAVQTGNPRRVTDMPLASKLSDLWEVIRRDYPAILD